MYMVTRAFSLLLILALVVPLLAQGTPADNKIYDQVRQKLANDPEVKGANLDVVVKNGAVTLTGTVNDIRAKEKAEKVTKKVKGVTSVVNELKIFGS
jgi:osmotically-inducible protein OsmY